MIPPSRILAGVDFSDASRVALTFAMRLARQCHAELHVVHSQEPLLAAAAAQRGVDLATESGEELRRFVPCSLGHGAPPLKFHVVTGAPVDAILPLAERESVDLLVVGARGISGAERLMFGSTTEALLRHANLSMLVVPESWTAPHTHRNDLSGVGPVIVGIELTPESMHTAAVATRLADLLHTETVMLHVVRELPVPARWRSDADSAVRECVQEARRELEMAAKRFRTNRTVHLEIQTGSIPERLAETAAASPRSLLVLGRAECKRPYGAPGTIAYRVLMQARVPVLMHLHRC